MMNFENMFNVASIMGIIILIISVLLFVIIIFTMFSPKLRSKFVDAQLKAQKQVIDDNEELLKDLNTRSAEITKDGTKVQYRAMAEGIKEGLGEEKIFCKYCGKQIDTDSKFCNGCGKEL